MLGWICFHLYVEQTHEGWNTRKIARRRNGPATGCSHLAIDANELDVKKHNDSHKGDRQKCQDLHLSPGWVVWGSWWVWCVVCGVASPCVRGCLCCAPKPVWKTRRLEEPATTDTTTDTKRRQVCIAAAALRSLFSSRRRHHLISSNHNRKAFYDRRWRKTEEFASRRKTLPRPWTRPCPEPLPSKR